MTMLDEFKKGIELKTNSIPFSDAGLKKLHEEAHESWIQMYNHADLTPTQARELGEIYVKLYFAQEEYLRLNKEFSKYTVK